VAVGLGAPGVPRVAVGEGVPGVSEVVGKGVTVAVGASVAAAVVLASFKRASVVKGLRE